MQSVIDAFADAYGWSKAVTLDLYPKEAEILIAKITKRQEQRDDMNLVRMIIAARAPHTEDHGEKLITAIMAKYKKLKDEGITAETIRKEMAIARSLLQR